MPKRIPVEEFPPDPNPSGLCQCGCGSPTSIIRYTDRGKGLYAGHHRRYLSGHQKRMNGCVVVGCEGEHGGLGYCTKHYQRFKTYGTTDLPQWDLLLCSVDGCISKARRRSGFCTIHYKRNLLHGTPDLQPHWTQTDKRESGIAKIAKANTGKVRTLEHRLAVSRAQKGRKRSPESIAKQVAAMPKTRNWGPVTEKQIAAARNARAAVRDRKGPTRIELACRWLLDELGVEFIEQHPIGVYTVDFYVPKIRLVVEADGAYWHQSEARERARDAYLMRDPSVDDVLHLTDEQLKPWTPKRSVLEDYRRAIQAA